MKKLKNFQQAKELQKQGIGVNEISRRIGIRRATVSAWLSRDSYEEKRGWIIGSYRTHTPEEAGRIVELKKARIEKKKYFLGSPHIRMDYAKTFPDESLPSLWFFDKVVRDAGLQTHEPKKRRKGQGIVERLRFPIRSIVTLGRIHQSSDFIGKKWITGRSEPIPIFSTSYYQWFQLYQIWRTAAETSACAIERLSRLWQTTPIPNVMRMDNGMTFRGGGEGHVSVFLKFLLNLNVIPLFSSPYQSFTNPHIEGHNRTFTEKLWQRHSFATLDEIDDACLRFNEESREYYEYAFHERLGDKRLRFLMPDQTIVADRLLRTRGKKVCFIRFVQQWIERNNETGIVLLNRFVALPENYCNQYVFVTIDLGEAMLVVTSEHDGTIDEILRQPFPFSL